MSEYRKNRRQHDVTLKVCKEETKNDSDKKTFQITCRSQCLGKQRKKEKWFSGSEKLLAGWCSLKGPHSGQIWPVSSILLMLDCWPGVAQRELQENDGAFGPMEAAVWTLTKPRIYSNRYWMVDRHMEATTERIFIFWEFLFFFFLGLCCNLFQSHRQA